MPVTRRQVFAFSGVLGGAAAQPANFALTEHAVDLAGPRDRPRACYLPTAVGDSPVVVESKRSVFRERRPDVDLTVLTLFPRPSVPDVAAHLLRQDVILVEGGSVVNLMALWHVHGLPAVLRECWEAGVVLAGASAGSLCWHVGGPTDSYREALDPFTDGLGLLPFSNGVHDDLPDQPRRDAYRSMVAGGRLPAGYATEGGVGLHHVGTTLHRAVSVRPGARAWWVQSDGIGGHLERPIIPTTL